MASKWQNNIKQMINKWRWSIFYLLWWSQGRQSSHVPLEYWSWISPRGKESEGYLQECSLRSSYLEHDHGMHRIRIMVVAALEQIKDGSRPCRGPLRSTTCLTCNGDDGFWQTAFALSGQMSLLNASHSLPWSKNQNPRAIFFIALRSWC